MRDRSNVGERPRVIARARFGAEDVSRRARRPALRARSKRYGSETIVSTNNIATMRATVSRVAVVPRARLYARCSSNGNDRVKASGKSPKSGKAATRRASIKGARDPGEDASRDF